MYEKIVGLTDDFCDRKLNSECRDLARNDRSAVQEAPEPTRFRATANVGVPSRLCAWQDQFSW
jgi:hypothetical protein